MKKKLIAVIILVTVLAATLGSPALVQANGDIQVLSHMALMQFPTQMSFSITAESDAAINDLRLHYRINRIELARITSEVYIEFTPATSITEQWVWDMRTTGGLPPGCSIDYWWTVSDADGDTLTTDPVNVPITDARYEWESLTEGLVTLYWYEGDNAFADELMASAQDALSRLDQAAGAELTDPVSIYIYASSTDLQGSMIYPQEWTGGVAFTRYGIVAIGIAPTDSDIAWGKRAIAHELTHLVVHQVTLNPYNDLPTWLDEGLAMSSEGELESYFVERLETARVMGTLFTVRSLASPFSTDTEKSLLSYAQSYEIVQYLINTYGQAKMLELLSTFQQGAGYDEALLKVYGFDMDGLNTEWRAAFEGVAVV